jgi:hypothetical protein
VSWADVTRLEEAFEKNRAQRQRKELVEAQLAVPREVIELGEVGRRVESQAERREVARKGLRLEGIERGRAKGGTLGHERIRKEASRMRLDHLPSGLGRLWDGESI